MSGEHVVEPAATVNAIRVSPATARTTGVAPRARVALAPSISSGVGIGATEDVAPRRASSIPAALRGRARPGGVHRSPGRVPGTSAPTVALATSPQRNASRLPLLGDSARDDAEPAGARRSALMASAESVRPSLRQDQVAEGEALSSQSRGARDGGEPRRQVDVEILVAPVASRERARGTGRRAGTARTPSRRRQRGRRGRGAGGACDREAPARRSTSAPSALRDARATRAGARRAAATRAPRPMPTSSSLSTCPASDEVEAAQVVERPAGPGRRCVRAARTAHPAPDALPRAHDRRSPASSAAASESTHVASTVPGAPDASSARATPQVVAPRPAPTSSTRRGRLAARARPSPPARARPQQPSGRRARTRSRAAPDPRRARSARALAGRCRTRRAPPRARRAAPRRASSASRARSRRRRARAPVVFEGADQLATEHLRARIARVTAPLQAEPAMRPEVVARGVTAVSRVGELAGA